MQKVSIFKHFFSEKEREIVSFNDIKVSLFKYDSGVEAIRLKNKNGEIIILPYQGQQIWRMEFFNHKVTMHSEFDEPVHTSDFHTCYGMFLLHCGLTAMGNPTNEDNHPQHGELPFAEFENPYILSGEDKNGTFVSIGGTYNHKRAFRVDYTFNVEYKLYENASTIIVDIKFTNNRPNPMEYFYMCHINFLPIDNSRLVYTARHEDIKPHYNLSDRLSKKRAEEYNEFFEKLKNNPAIQDNVDSRNQVYDPEICSTIKYLYDGDKKAHAMQIMPDGFSCYVNFNPIDLPIGLRWIARTGLEDAMGIVLPATAEHFGYNYCKKHHFERYLDSDQTVQYEIEVGVLSKEDTKIKERHIYEVLKR